MVSGVSPFHQPGAGRLTSTVSWPGLAGVRGNWPFCAGDVAIADHVHVSRGGPRHDEAGEGEGCHEGEPAKRRGGAGTFADHGKSLLCWVLTAFLIDGPQPRRLLLDASFEAGSGLKDKGCREQFGTKLAGGAAAG